MNNAEIISAGFSAIRRSPRRIIANIQSIKKSVGKTRLALTAPKPIGLIIVEVGGDEGVADQFIPAGMELNEDIQKVEIHMESPNYPNPNDFNLDDKASSKKYDEAVHAAVQEVAAPAMDAFYNAYYTSLKHMATTIVDTGTDLYRLCRLANFGRTEKIPQLAYTAVKNDFAKMLDDAFSAKGNVLWIHHMKDKGETIDDGKGSKKWVESGNFQINGCEVITDKVQAVIELWRDDLTEADEKTGRMVKFHGQIVDSRHNPDAMGSKFVDDDLTFAQIGMALIPSTKESDWR